MKRIIVVLVAVFACLATFAQKTTETPEAPYLPIDERTNLVTYQDVVKQEGTPKVLYDRAMEWAKKCYKNTGEVIKSADPEKCVINMRSSVRIFYKDKDGTMRFKNIVYYNFKLECRDNRYRYTITDFKEKATGSAPIEVWFDTSASGWTPSMYGYLSQIDEEMQKLIESLEEGMQPAEEFVDEW
ncbi:MAG: DUF4468 domain-containing protein [Bacteroidales bacterium]|nr:DUF4468 domain-containing protein [Bacteroidales bacterium]